MSRRSASREDAASTGVSGLAAVETEPWWRHALRGFRSHRRRLRFTREGKVFVLLAAGIGVGAVNTGNNLLYLLLGAMLALIVASGVLAEVALRGVEVWRRAPPELYAAVETTILVGVRNRKAYLPSFSLAVREHFGRKRMLDPVPFVHVGPGATRHGGYQCVFPRRGRCRFRGWTVETTFPFGLFGKSRYLEGPDNAVVYPRTDVPLEIPTLPGHGLGDGRSRRGPGTEFYALREYRPGDDPRRIAWKVSAQRGKLVTREVASGALQAVELYLANVAASARRDPLFEAAVDHTASLAVRLLEQGHEVGLTTLDGRVPPGEGPSHQHRLLTALALLRQLSPEEATEAAAQADLAPRGGADRIVVQTPWSEAFATLGSVVATIAVTEAMAASLEVARLQPSPVDMVA